MLLHLLDYLFIIILAQSCSTKGLFDPPVLLLLRQQRLGGVGDVALITFIHSNIIT